MVLRKQSIRRIEEVTLNGKVTSKEELISLSTTWVEKEVILFKKILSQGGSCKIKQNTLRVSKRDVQRPVSDRTL
jgi:hypothetical protein|tara:strand:+ start:2033 stop:2257 length:225 start_codon:yes stop_codon:yes gene_type:complete